MSLKKPPVLKDWRLGKIHESISFLVGIEKKLRSFMPRFSPAFESRVRVESHTEARVNISFP